MKQKHYRGWNYDFNSNRPVTGTWHANRFGVGMSANSEEALRGMIDAKIEEQQSLDRADKHYSKLNGF